MPAYFFSLLKQIIDLNASDLYLVPGYPPTARQDGILSVLSDGAVDVERILHIRDHCLSVAQKKILQNVGSVDFSWDYLQRRWRGNIYYEQGKLAAVFRLVPEKIPTPQELGFNFLDRFSRVRQGMILVTGYAGAGKSTTLAALVTMMTQNRPMHLVTLEDPVEYVYKSKKSLFSQREYGRDFFSFSAAIAGVLRQMPDALLVGEIRDRATMSAALMAAESGLLVLGTLHAPRATEAARRVEGMFPVAERDAVRDQFAAVIAGIISQRLLPALPTGRVAVAEVLVPDNAVRNIIRQGRYQQLESSMLSGEKIGMQTLSVALQRLRQAKKISDEVFYAAQLDSNQ